jgi:hypothetical protein
MALLVMWFAFALAGAGCRTMRKYTAFGFGVGPGAQLQQALTSSIISRASGGCYSDCRPGTRCVEATGFCEPIEQGDGEVKVLFLFDAGQPNKD